MTSAVPVARFENMRGALRRLQLIKLGPAEGELPVHLVAPRLRAAPDVTTRLVGEVTGKNTVLVPPKETKPRAGEAYVFRIATYEGDQLVGGCTLVVGQE